MSSGAKLAMCQKAQKPHVMVLNAVLARSRLVGDAVELPHIIAPALKTIIHQRQHFASSVIDGRTAGELEPRSTATEEITALWRALSTQVRTDGKE